MSAYEVLTSTPLSILCICGTA